jgi:polyribonucleotide nucleotidyltransferase
VSTCILLFYIQCTGFTLEEKFISATLKEIEKREMREMILSDNIRLDGRNTTTIRPITCEINVLPRAHGSSLFTRGETQALTTATLGTTRDQQNIEGLLPEAKKRFMPSWYGLVR